MFNREEYIGTTESKPGITYEEEYMGAELHPSAPSRLPPTIDQILSRLNTIENGLDSLLTLEKRVEALEKQLELMRKQ